MGREEGTRGREKKWSDAFRSFGFRFSVSFRFAWTLFFPFSPFL